MVGHDEILTALEVAKILKCSKSKVYELRANGDLRARFKIFEGEKGWRWTRQDVADYLDTRIDPYFVDFAATKPYVPINLKEIS